MPLTGPIIYIEDDIDDQYLVNQIIEEMKIPNRLVFFSNGLEALRWFETAQEQPFLILCDINMPMMNGLELRRQLMQNESLRQKTIPFVFLTTAVTSRSLQAAYDEMAHGYFKKGSTYKELQFNLKCIIAYWKHSLHPNKRV